jgi:hypothetical protein
MAAMRKLHRSVVWSGQSPVGAVHVGRGEIVWQDRYNAANGSKEPSLPIFCNAAKVCFHGGDQNRDKNNRGSAKGLWRTGYDKGEWASGFDHKRTSVTDVRKMSWQQSAIFLWL